MAVLLLFGLIATAFVRCQLMDDGSLAIAKIRFDSKLGTAGPHTPLDMILWDNRVVLHRATSYANTTEKRLMVRTTIASDGPTVSRAAA